MELRKFHPLIKYRNRMGLKIFVIVLLASLERPCLSAITIRTHQRDVIIDHLVEATNKILTSCYGEQIKAVGVYGDSKGSLLGTRLSRTIPVISINRTKKVADNEIVLGKLEAFTILAESPTQLHSILRQIRDSPWWNHMASFLILNRSTDQSDNDCSNAFEFLRVAWTMDLLNAKFLCAHTTNQVSIYSYNPYTEIAPSPWKLWNTTKATDDQPWSMFVRQYRKDDDICDGLDFDKTRDLGGYTISCTVHDVDGFWHTNPNETGTASFGSIDGMIAKIWFRKMNAQAKLTIHDVDDPTVMVKENGETIGIAMDLKNGTSDVLLNSYYFSHLTNFTVTYPQLNGGLGVATQRSRPRSVLSKINSVMDVESRYGLYLVMLITPVVLKFLSRKPLAPAILNTIRIICNSGLTKVPDNTATRIFLAALFSFQITIIGIYSGKLASLLTTPAYHRNVDTMQDLVELGHTIYVHKAHANLFKDPIIADRIVELEQFYCVKYVLNDSTIACILDWDILRSGDPDSRLHMSRDMIKKTWLVFGIRDNWPLEQRLGRIIAGMVENGILARFWGKSSAKFARLDEFIEYMRNQPSLKIITLDELSFAFAILGFGLACATVIFIFEVIIG